MTRKAYQRFRLAALLLVMAGALITNGSRPQAAACMWLPFWTYYTDASRTEACGSYNHCTGYLEGCITQYKTSERIFCCDSVSH